MLMKDDDELRKIKSQKFAAVLLITGPSILILTEFKKNDYDITGTLNFYLLISSLVVLIICGSFGLRNSLRKEKEL